MNKLYGKTLTGLTVAVSIPLLSGVASQANTPIVDLVGDSANGSIENAVSLSVSHSAVEAMPSAQALGLSVDIAQATSNSSDEEIRQQLLIEPGDPNAVPEIDVLDRRPQPIPSSTFITPNAYGADWGDVYLGVAGTTEDGTDDGLDGAASVGFGLGDAVKNVGVEVNVGIISLDGFADDGTAGFKLHKVFPGANNLGVAVGWTNPIKWGNADRKDTFYGVATQRFDLRPNRANSLPLTTSLGVGTGLFRSKGAIEDRNNAPNVFGSIGLRVIPQVSVVSSWTGRSLGLAASAAPFSSVPIVLTAGVSDLTDNTEEGTQFVGSLGYSFGF